MSRSSFRASRGLSGILITCVKDEVRWSVAPPEGPQAPSVAVQRLVLASFTQVFAHWLLLLTLVRAMLRVLGFEALLQVR